MFGLLYIHSLRPDRVFFFFQDTFNQARAVHLQMAAREPEELNCRESFFCCCCLLLAFLFLFRAGVFQMYV